MNMQAEKTKQLSDFPPVLTVDQAAELLQLDRGTVYELIRKQVIPTYPPGMKRNKRISRDALMGAMAKGL